MDPNVEKLIREDPDAGREVLLKMLQHSAKCKDCPVIRLVRLQAAASERKRKTG